MLSPPHPIRTAAGSGFVSSTKVKGQRPGLWLTFAILVAASALLYIWKLQALFSFAAFGFRDQGSNLMLVRLLQEGLRPSIDFGYAYGFLSASFSRLWFSVCGITPACFVGALFFLNLIVCYCYARVLQQLGSGYGRLLVLLILLPWACSPGAPSHTHLLETALLLGAVTLHLQGRLRWALALCATCLFVKPSMAYFYGLILVVSIIIATRPFSTEGLRRFFRDLAPSILIVLSLSLLLGSLYGWDALLQSLVGKAGKSTYTVNHYGAFRLGRPFFWSPGYSFKYYLAQPAGFWIFSTLAMFMVAIPKAVTVFRGGTLTANETLIVTLALSQLFFITILFAGPWSWFYYLFILVVFWLLIYGEKRWRYLLAAAIPLFLVGSFVDQREIFHQWKTQQSDVSTDGLWTDPPTLAHWKSILALAPHARIAIVSFGGASAILFPDLQTASRLFLERGLTTPHEAANTLQTIKNADYVILPAGPSYLDFRTWPQFQPELSKFHTISQSDAFTVLKRSSY